ncbi:MAG TPA: YXWGXW repeat-containing protein [Magnetospirillaceae bacterium]
MAEFKRPSLKSLLLAATVFASPLVIASAHPALADLAIQVNLAPPALPVYDQPPIPGPGYMWTPGYWAYSQDAGYYWVPGTWVEPPVVGVLWTPPYWGWDNGVYLFHAGYWGPHVGFYGGVNYGFGYGGAGYEGGRWSGHTFVYNRTVNNFGSAHITNVYSRQVRVVNRTNVSYVGGTGGIHATPTAAERAAFREHHAPMPEAQVHHFDAAAHNPAFAAKTNGGHPAVAAVAHAGQFEGPGVTRDRAAAAAPRPGEHPAPGPHPAAEAHPQPGTAPHPMQADQHPAGAAPGPHPPAEAAQHPAEAPRPAAEAAHPEPAPHPTAEAHPAPAPHPAEAQQRPAAPAANQAMAAHRPPPSPNKAPVHPAASHAQGPTQRPAAQHAAPRPRPAAAPAAHPAPAPHPAAAPAQEEKKQN